MRRCLPPVVLLLALLSACNTPTNPPTQTLTPSPRAASSTPDTSPTRASTPLTTPTPLVVAPPESPPPDCDDAPRTRLITSERGRVLTDDPRALNIRAAPGTSNAILGTIGVDEVFYVITGPECADKFYWYLVHHHGTEGWIAEGDSDNYYVEPHLPG